MITGKNISLVNANTFGIDAMAAGYAEAGSRDDVIALYRDGAFREPFFILGGGSNILLLGDFDGLVVKNCIKGITEEASAGGEVVVCAGAGVEWDDLVRYCVDRNYGGIENLSLIPGRVGAAPIQNIGAYGCELKDAFEQLEAIDLQTGEVSVFRHKDCRFGYRDSIFKHELKGRLMIVSVSLRLRIGRRPDTSYGAIRQELDSMGAGKDPDIRAVGRAVSAIRERKLPDPEETGNAGSFFKNPLVSKSHFDRLKERYPDIHHYPDASGNVKIPAGWMIEACGWKGKKMGRAGVHAKQALVLVNHGNASGREIMELATAVKASVAERFGIDLEMEVNVVGDLA